MVNQYRPVAVAAPEGEIVDTERGRRARLGQRQAAHEPEERRPADGDGAATGEALAWPTAEGQADVLRLCLQRRASPGVTRHQVRALLSECPRGAVRGTAAEAPDAPTDGDMAVADRLIRDMADVVGVDVAGAPVARRARGAPSCRLHVEDHLIFIVGHGDVEHAQPAQVGEQGRQAHRNLLHRHYSRRYQEYGRCGRSTECVPEPI